MTAIITRDGLRDEVESDVVHVHFQVDNWVVLSFEGEPDKTIRLNHLTTVSIVPD